MFTVKVTLSFRDGATATAKITARCPQSDYPITYAGASDRFGWRPEKGSASDLQMLCKQVARATGADLQIELTGDYETWAE